MSQTIPDIADLKKAMPESYGSFRFSIRSLMIATALVALLMAAVVAPAVLAVVTGVIVIAMTAIVVTTVYIGRGWIQAFAIGSLVPNVLSYLVLFEGFRSPQALMVFAMVSLLASFVIGCLAALTHGYLKRRGGRVRVPNLPLVRDWLTNQ